MNAEPFKLHSPAVAPEVVCRLALILAGLAAVVARRFLREPKLVGLIIPLWSWLSRSARRFERAVTRPVVRVPAVVRVRRVAARAVAVPSGIATPLVRLPSRKAWLVRALGWEAAAYGSQLSHLLGEPEMQAVLASVPAVGRILRPLCRMLGATGLEGTPAAPVARAKRVRPKVVRVVREVREVERRHSPVSHWIHRRAKTPG